MKMIGVRFEDAQIEALEALSRRQGRTISEVVRGLVEHGLAEPPKPAPQPPPLDPAPPPEGGQGLPDALSGRVAELRRDLDRLNRRRLLASLQYWGPKALALAAADVPFRTGDAQTQANALGAAMLLIVIDAFWTGRVLRREALALARRELADLLEAVPGLWAQACRTQVPAEAEAQVLAEISERRRRLGELCADDLGLGGSTPA